jgi:hypothetical protein
VGRKLFWKDTQLSLFLYLSSTLLGSTDGRAGEFIVVVYPLEMRERECHVRLLESCAEKLAASHTQKPHTNENLMKITSSLLLVVRSLGNIIGSDLTSSILFLICCQYPVLFPKVQVQG